MNTLTNPNAEPRALFSQDGQTWTHTEGTGPVVKIVIGTPPKRGEEAKPVTLSAKVKSDLETHLPTVTHLHLWQVGAKGEGGRKKEEGGGFPSLASFPNLETLDLRGCTAISKLPALPASLDTLVLGGCPLLKTLPIPKGGLPLLEDASFRGCTGLAETALHTLLAAAPALRKFDASDCPELTCIEQWPVTLERIELNGCKNLTALPTNWPRGSADGKKPFYRLGLRGATSLRILRRLPKTLDYVDLAFTESLRTLPKFGGKPKTLFLFGSGVAVNPALYGKADTENVALAVLAEHAEDVRGRVPDNEVKVILLGNGRCGKSSLVRRWVEDKFKRDEPSTHGIRLWKAEVGFDPFGGSTEKAQLRIWDFAGQDLYHNTHRLFLQSRAIFILCYTDSGPGFDEASDKTERERAEDEEDVYRSLSYWRSQVDSLGDVPGLKMRPPVLVVRTKANRKEKGKRQEHDLDLSAETGEGLDALKKWVENATREILGRRDARMVPKTVMNVKMALAERMALNDEAHRMSEETRKPVRSPHPYLAYKEFADFVRHHCPRNYYAKNPDLLLERFHRNGFVFFDKEHLPDRVILDQRWAINAIYTIANRESEWNIRETLWRRNGQFTPSMLGKAAWTPAGYLPAEQEMILHFMVACGMCFVLLRSDEAAAGEPVYAAPGFFPSRADILQRMPELAGGEHGGGQLYVLKNVAEAEMLSLLSNLGKDWSRSASLWRWGACVTAADSGARVLLDWQRVSSDDYTGTLSVRFPGILDRVLIGEVFDRLENICSDRQTIAEIRARRGEIPASEMDASLANVRMPHSRDRGRTIPPREEGVGVRVTFSFAGSDAKEFPMIGELPSLLGKKLKAQFEQDRQGQVFCYDQPEGEERLSVFTESLAKGDLMLVFWSEKYWRSLYCCTEMMLIYQAPPAVRLLDHRVVVWVVDGGRVSKSGPIRGVDFEKRWVAKATDREKQAEVDANGDLRRKKRYLKQDGVCHEWYEFALSEDTFDRFIVALREYRLGRPINTPVDSDEAERMAESLLEEVRTLVRDPVAVLDLAMGRLEKGRKEDAVSLLIQFLAKNSDGQRSVDDLIRLPGKHAVPAELLATAREVLGIEPSE